jgi:hypothetical protein
MKCLSHIILFLMLFFVSCKKINLDNPANQKMITQACPLAGENAGPDKLICTSTSSSTQIGLPPVAGFSYHWVPTTGLSNPNISNPIASPTVSTTYTLYTTSINYINNGDFELGNTGFTSEYIFNNYITPQWFGTSQYRISQNPLLSNSLWCKSDDHTIYGANMMLIDGNGGAIVRKVWSQDVQNINQNTNYYFSAHILAVTPFDQILLPPAVYDGRPNIEIRINGVVMSNTIHTFRGCFWEEISFPYNSGSLTHALIEIRDLNLQEAGNDFALDDIYLGECQGNLTTIDDVNVSVSSCTNIPTAIATNSYFAKYDCTVTGTYINSPIIPSFNNNYCTYWECGGYSHIFSSIPNNNNEWYINDILVTPANASTFGQVNTNNLGELIHGLGNNAGNLFKFQVKNTTYGSQQLSPPTYVYYSEYIGPGQELAGYYKKNYTHDYTIPYGRRSGPNTTYSWSIPGCTVTNLDPTGFTVQINFPLSISTSGVNGTLTVSNSNCQNGTIPINFNYNPNL